MFRATWIWFILTLKSREHFICRKVEHLKKIVLSADSLLLWVLYGSRTKSDFFTLNKLTAFNYGGGVCIQRFKGRYFRHFRVILIFNTVVTLLMQSVAGFSPLRSGFNPNSVHVRFVLEEVTLEEVILLGIAFFPFQYHSTNAPSSSSSACYS